MQAPESSVGPDGRPRVCHEGRDYFEVVDGLVVVPEQQAPQQLPHLHAIRAPPAILSLHYAMRTPPVD